MSVLASLLLAAVTAPAPAAVAPVPAAPVATPQQAPFGYLTAGKLAERCADPTPYAVSYCYAYLAGIHDAMRAYEVWLGQKEFCTPAQLSQKALRDVFVTFITANPRFREAQSASAAVVALKEAYPCKPATP